VKKNYDNTLSHFHTIPERNGRTDGQTDLLYQYRASVKDFLIRWVWKVHESPRAQKFVFGTTIQWTIMSIYIHYVRRWRLWNSVVSYSKGSSHRNFCLVAIVTQPNGTDQHLSDISLIGRRWDVTSATSNKNLAIANRSRVSCAHNSSRASPWPLNLR